TQLFGDFGQGAIESTAAGFDQLPRGVAHALHFLLILEEVDPLNACVFGIIDLDGGASFEESRGNRSEIRHGIAEDRDFAERGRLQNIVSAGRNERAADEHAIGDMIQRCKISDAVEEENGNVIGDVAASAVAGNAWTGNSKFGAANEFAMRFVDEFGGGSESLWPARGEDQEGLWKIALDDTEGDERERFFGGNDTTRDDDRPTTAALGFFS